MNKRSVWRRRLIPVVTLFLAAGTLFGLSLAPQASAAPAAAPAMSAGCATLNDPTFDTTSPGGSLPALELWEGERILIQADDGPASYTITLYLNAVAVASDTLPPRPGTISYVVPTDMNVSIAWGFSGGAPNPVWDVQCLPRPSECGVPLTPWAVVGRFTADAPTYWAPDRLVAPRTTIPAGKTAWVLGMDASGGYYKIVWACDTLWVPANTMGPNIGDPIWDGTPLPTNTVE